MTIIFSSAARTARGSADLTSIGTNASLVIYSGTRPATPDTAVVSGDVALASFSMGSGNAFGTVSGGVLTAGTIPSTTILAATSYTAVASGTTTMTVSGTVTGTIAVGQLVTGTNVTAGSYIVALGTGTGGTGTYILNVAQTFASTTVTSSGAGAGVTAVWARLFTSAGVAVEDFDISTTAAGTGDIQFASTTFVAGVTCQISSFVETIN